MANVLANIVGGPGNDVFFGNTVRASIAVIAFQVCTQNTASLGNSSVNVSALPLVGGVRTIPTINAPVVSLTATGPVTDLALGVPNLTGAGNGCPIVALTIINCSGHLQSFDTSPTLSNVKNTDLVNEMPDGNAYNFYYDPTQESWVPLQRMQSP